MIFLNPRNWSPGLKAPDRAQKKTPAETGEGLIGVTIT